LVNVIPDDVRLEFMVRGNNLDAILDASMKVDRALKAGADALGAEVEIEDVVGYLPVRINNDLMDIMFENQRELLGEDNVLYEADKSAASTDAGDVSAIIPTLHALFGGCSGDLHSVDFKVTDKEVAYIATAKCLAMTVIDLLADNAVEALKVKDNFKQLMTKKEYLSNWGKVKIV